VKRKYSGYEVIQVGLPDDLDAQVVDCRGLDDIWEVARIIASAKAFIGVDSGPSWIAACFPSVFNKKVLVQYPVEYLRTSFVPMHVLRFYQHWHDMSFTYFNRTKDDADVTYSYLKL
jgi:ADP-heptose:LPS heptosyltransferase